MQPVKSTYPTLRKQVAQLLSQGRTRAQRAVERERVRTYREVGRLIHEHLLDRQDRAEYGDRLIARLSDDVQIGKTALYDALNFYRSASIFRTSGNLDWSHYTELLKLPSPDQRRKYATRADENNWSVRELRVHIRAEREAQASASTSAPVGDATLPALRGEYFTYRLIPGTPADALRLDLGFGIYLAHDLDSLRTPKPDDRVASSATSTGYRLHPISGRKSAYYSYVAHVDQVIDGDTLWLDIDCGFGVWTRQKVRLRGIDTPEIATDTGKRAKRFVEDQLRQVSFVAVTTTKPDKFDRYLADIFYLPDETDPKAVLQNGHFLNRNLLAEGLAQRFRE